MEQLKNFTMDKVYQKIFLPDNEFDQWLVELGLLHTTMICECGNLMIVRKPKNGERYGRWRCNISKCRKEKSFLAGTFFSGSHVTTKNVFAMAYWWAMKFGGEEDWVREFGVASHTVVDWRNSFRDVCAQYLEKTNNIKKEIEEPGDEEVEEPLPVKRKYNKGELNKEVWLYGGECLWRKKFGSRNEIFYNFWFHVSHIFPCYKVTE